MDWRSFAEDFRALSSTQLVTFGNTVVTAASVVIFLAILIATFWFSRILQRVVRQTLARGGIEDGNIAAVSRLLHYGVVLIGGGVALQSVGVSLSTVFAAGAVVAVAIGFAMQDILQNFISGLILLTERSITEADVLEIEGRLVLVENIGIRATVARTLDDEQLIVPNSLLVQSTVKNFTLTDAHFRVRTTVGVSYSSDMAKVEEVLVEAARSVKRRDPSKNPIPLLLEFGDSSVVWEISVWATDPWAARVTRSDLNKAIWWGLKEAGITIAFPQVDVHMHTAPSAGAATP